MAQRRSRKLTTRQLALTAARIAHDRHLTDVVVLDLRDISPVADYFVIATGNSDVQMRAVADEVQQTAAKGGHRPYGEAGRESGRWVLLDFVDVVVHLFDEEFREYYDLEMMWGDAPRVRWKRPEGATGRRSSQT